MNTNSIWILFLRVLFLSGALANQSAAQSVRMSDEHTLEITGPITRETGVAFRDLVDANAVRTVVLESPGGLLYVALEIAEQIHSDGINTWVKPGGECYSACSLIFLAGERRLADGNLGVHQVAADRQDNSLTQAVIADVFAALARYGAPDELIAVMLRTPPEEMYVFSEEEVARLGITRREPQVTLSHLQVVSSALYGDWLVGTFLNTQTGRPFIAMESREINPVFRIVHYPPNGIMFGEILWSDERYANGMTDLTFIFERDTTANGPGEKTAIRIRSDVEPTGYAWDFIGDTASIAFLNRFIYGHRLRVENFAGETVAQYGLSGTHKAVGAFTALLEQ